MERAIATRPTVETLSQELEDAGFDFVDVELRTKTLRFQSGRDFFEDPATRLLIVPDLRPSLGLADLRGRYLASSRDAIPQVLERGDVRALDSSGVRDWTSHRHALSLTASAVELPPQSSRRRERRGTDCLRWTNAAWIAR